MARLHKNEIKLENTWIFSYFDWKIDVVTWFSEFMFVPGLVSSSPVDKMQMGTSEMCVESTATPTLANSDLN